MDKLLTNLAKFMIENPEVLKKSEPEIYNIWFAKEKKTLKSINDVKIVLEYIQSIKKIPDNLILDSLRKE